MKNKKPWETGRLQVKDNCPYLFNGEELFFWLGDTAWLIFHELTREEIRIYLKNRAEKGFNVIQVVAAHHLPAKNVAGREAFYHNDVSKPDIDGEEHYWKLVDETIKEAEALGMYIALLPHWGSLAQSISIEDMEQYVCFLAKRYGNAPNLIWVTGGDTRGNEAAEYWRCMGQTLRSMCPEHLITFHPFGRTSSIDYFKNEEWVDFHMFQSGHRRYDQKKLSEWDDNEPDASNYGLYYGEDNWRYVKDVSRLQTVSPILDAEPSYEHIPQGLHQEMEPYWATEQVRRYGWWSVLAGACGFTYGHNSIMQFYRGIGEGAFFVKLPWQDALHAPAADSMVHMKRVMERILKEGWKQARSCEDLLGGISVWTDDQKEDRILALGVGKWIVCYTYLGKPVELLGSKMKEYGKGVIKNQETITVHGWWMHPESGVESYFGSRGVGDEILSFQTPKGDESHKDWVLILELV